MRPTVLMAALSALGAILTGPETAVADTLNLVCHVQESRTDGAHRIIMRRLDLDLTAKTVRVSDDVGHGWVFKRQYAFLAASHDRIQLESAEGKESFVDRRTGEYFLHNQSDGVTMRGRCRKADGAPIS